MLEIKGRIKKTLGLGVALSALTLLPPSVSADSAGRGATAQFEREYLTFIINHHFSALRMSELAAGTDAQRDATVNNPQEGTSPTPGTDATQAKATDEEIKSMAREANRMQREEIAKAQRFLRDWYGVNVTPQATPEGQQAIQTLEQASTGEQFNRTFLQVFSSHHYRALPPSLDCQVKSDLEHDELLRYCENIVVTQKNQINDMRDHLCKDFNICDFQPSTAARGQNSGATGRQ